MAGARYVAVTLAEIEAFLLSKSPRFERGMAGNEVVLFVRHPKIPDLRVEVYTSVGVGEAVVRPCGQDAIKVLAVYDDGMDKRFSLEREARRVLRVDSVQGVLDRTYAGVVAGVVVMNNWARDKAQGRDATLQPGWRAERLAVVTEAA